MGKKSEIGQLYNIDAFSYIYIYLLSPVDDVFWVGEPPCAGTSNHGVVSGRGVGDAHRRDLLNGLAQSHATEEQSPS